MNNIIEIGVTDEDQIAATIAVNFLKHIGMSDIEIAKIETLTIELATTLKEAVEEALLRKEIVN